MPIIVRFAGCCFPDFIGSNLWLCTIMELYMPIISAFRGWVCVSVTATDEALIQQRIIFPLPTLDSISHETVCQNGASVRFIETGAFFVEKFC
jgi:hypothetical protein